MPDEIVEPNREATEGDLSVARVEVSTRVDCARWCPVRFVQDGYPELAKTGQMEELIRPASGTYANNGTPVGRTSLTPHIVVSPARKAIEFYRSALGAKVGDVTEMGGAVAHAELDFGCGWLTLGEPIPDLGLAAPTTGPVTYSLALYVPNVGEVTEMAVAAGAKLNSPAATFVSGDRFSSILDPFGVRWTIMTRVEDISPEEGARRVAEWARQQ